MVHNVMFIQRLIKDLLDEDDVLFVVSYDHKDIVRDDPHIMAAFVVVTNDAVHINIDMTPSWAWLPIGGGGQHYILSELTLKDFYKLMLGAIVYPNTHTPKKVLKTYYRR